MTIYLPLKYFYNELPRTKTTIHTCMRTGGHDGTRFRYIQEAKNTSPKVNSFVTDATDPTPLQLLDIFFFKEFIMDATLQQTNECAELVELWYGKFLTWSGIWILRDTIQGQKIESSWTVGKYFFQGTSFWLNEQISRNYFQNIIASIIYKEKYATSYKDNIFEV